MLLNLESWIIMSGWEKDAPVFSISLYWTFGDYPRLSDAYPKIDMTIIIR